jgi:hyperosmotically inducible protein
MNLFTRSALVTSLAALALAGCDRNDDRPIGQKIDSAIDRTQQKLSDAGHKIQPKVEAAAEKTQVALADAGAKTQQALAGAGEKLEHGTDRVIASVNDSPSTGATSASVTPSGEAVSSPGAGKPVSDTAITASIKTDFLKDPDLSVLKIDVDTRGGVVTLNGLAADEAARQRAEKMAGAVKGVKEVRNFLVIKRA